jgi:ADP-heptose:LPS heptosyltransferase
MKREQLKTPLAVTRSRSLILFPGALGDFICLVPTIERIRQQSTVELLARTEFADLLSSSVPVRRLDCEEVNRLFVAGAGDDAWVRRFFNSYDFIYSWFGSRQRIFAEELRRASQDKVRIFAFRPLPGRMHQTDYYLACIEQTTGAVPSVSVKPQAQQWCDNYWQQHAFNRRPVLVLAPGSGGREKNWPDASYQAVAEWWRKEFQGVVIVVLGPVEDERGGVDSVCRGSVVARALTLGQLSALLSRCLVYVGNDSGPTHLAAALGVRTVALFGPSDPRQWAPRGQKVAIVRSGVACSPCSSEVLKSCTHRDCLRMLEPAVVIRTLKTLPELTSGLRAPISFAGENLSE